MEEIATNAGIFFGITFLMFLLVPLFLFLIMGDADKTTNNTKEIADTLTEIKEEIKRINDKI